MHYSRYIYGSLQQAFLLCICTSGSCTSKCHNCAFAEAPSPPFPVPEESRQFNCSPWGRNIAVSWKQWGILQEEEKLLWWFSAFFLEPFSDYLWMGVRKYRSLSEAPLILLWSSFVCIQCLPSPLLPPAVLSSLIDLKVDESQVLSWQSGTQELKHAVKTLLLSASVRAE